MKYAWRIAVATKDSDAADPNDVGAQVTGGRWNSQGNAMLYCADSIALAALETAVHLKEDSLPLHRHLIRVEVPDPVWQARIMLDLNTAPNGWNALPAAPISADYGDRWLADAASAALCVPSVVVPEEFNILINPCHPDMKLIIVKTTRRWHYDPRLITPRSSR